MFDVALTENDEGKFNGSLWFPITIEFVRNESKKVSGFLISDTRGARAENIKFRKLE
jgi:hypothetical protein